MNGKKKKATCEKLKVNYWYNNHDTFSFVKMNSATLLQTQLNGQKCSTLEM